MSENESMVLVTALKAEARPVIDALSLKHVTGSSPFSLFQKENITLLVSGIGKINTALAMGYLAGRHPSVAPIWLHFGICGHRTLPVGTGVMAHKVTDQGSGKSLYPTFLPPLSPLFSAPFVTVDQGETQFGEEAVYDMESFSFMQAALSFSSTELVHCYKVVSDNLQERISFTPAGVEKLLHPHISKLQTLLLHLSHLSSKRPPSLSLSIEEFTSRWHFTETEKHKLKRLCNRFFCIHHTLPSPASFFPLSEAKEILHKLQQTVQTPS